MFNILARMSLFGFPTFGFALRLSSQAKRLTCKSGVEMPPDLAVALAPMMNEWRQTNSEMPLSAESISNASHHSYQENRYRLQKAVDKLWNEKKGLNIVIFGGSLTAGVNCKTAWPTKLGQLFAALSNSDIRHGEPEASLVETYIDNMVEVQRISTRFGNINIANIANHAAAGTTTQHVLDQLASFKDHMNHADIIINEYQFNENGGTIQQRRNGGNRSQMMEGSYTPNAIFISHVMSLPNKPAFLFLDIPSWFTPTESLKQTSRSSIHYEVAKHFYVPLIWYPDAVRHAGKLYLDYDDNKSGLPDGKVTIKGSQHPSCFPGHNLLASLVFGSILQEIQEVCKYGARGEDVDVSLSDKTKQMVACYAYPTTKATSEDGIDEFHAKVTSGWKFFEDRPGKPGWIADGLQRQEILFQDIVIERGYIGIEYLKTYTPMGKAECFLEDAYGNQIAMADANITSLKMDGRWQYRVSLTNNAFLKNVPKGTYNFRCQSYDGKFKITGLNAC